MKLRRIVAALALASAATAVALPSSSPAAAVGPCSTYGRGTGWASGKCPVGQRFQLVVTFWKPGLTSVRISGCEDDGYAVQIAPYGGQVVTAISVRGC